MENAGEMCLTDDPYGEPQHSTWGELNHRGRQGMVAASSWGGKSGVLQFDGVRVSVLPS